MSFIPVFEYLLGIGVFGFTYWLLNGILDTIVDTGIHESGTIFDLLFYVWVGVLLVYLIFGGWWMIRRYDESQYRQGGKQL